MVEEIRPHTLGFEVRYDGHGCVARRVILATGIQDSLPAMDDADAAILSGTVRLCAICDGYEVDGHEVAVYGEAESTIGHAVFLRSFTDRVTVIAKPGQPPREEALALVRHYGIRYLEAEVGQVHYRPGEGVEVVTRDGARHRFELLYPNLARGSARSWRSAWARPATRAAACRSTTTDRPRCRACTPSATWFPGSSR